MNDLARFQEFLREEGKEPLPTRWEVCFSCKGEGRSSRYLGAFTSDDMYELGDEFREDYVSGVYDRMCDECEGRSTVREPDYDRMTPDQNRDWDGWVHSYSALRAEEAAERKFGC